MTRDQLIGQLTLARERVKELRIDHWRASRSRNLRQMAVWDERLAAAKMRVRELEEALLTEDAK